MLLPPAQRPWVVDTTPGPAVSRHSELPGWEEKVPSLKRRSDLSHRFRRGDARVDPSEVPDVVRLLEKGERLPDGFKVMNGILLVTGAVREVVEELDPVRHQFVPIRVTLRNGTPIEKDWHVLVITHRQDTVVIEQSQLRYSDEGWRETWYMYRRPDTVTLDPARLDDSHLWWEERLHGGHALFMSHALKTALKARDPRVLRQRRTRRFVPAN